MRPSAAPPPEESLVRSKSPEGVRRMFSDIAPTYDFLNHLLSGGVDVWWRRVAAARLLTRDTDRVLDICSGTGDLTLALAARARQIGTTPLLMASDFTPAMTRLAAPKFARAFSRSASHHLLNSVGDALHLPVATSSFDLVTVAFGIRNVADLEKGLREMTRVARPGGTVAVLEFSHPRTPLFRWIYDFYFHQVLPRIGRALTGTRAYMYLPKSVASFPDTMEFASLLSRVTGTSAEARRLTFGIATLYTATVKK